MSTDSAHLANIIKNQNSSQVQDQVLEVLAIGDDYVRRTLRAILPPGGLEQGAHVLEIGAGVGTYTKELLAAGYNVTALESDELRCAELTKIVQCHAGSGGRLTVIHYEIGSDHIGVNQAHGAKLAASGPFDALIAINVVEHIADDVGALTSLREHLKPGAWALILVPAHAWLYSALDKAIFHFRRYNKSGLNKVLTQAGFQIKRTRYFNALAAVAWFVNFRLLGRKTMPAGQFSLFEKLQPLLKLEDYLRFPFGLSVVAWAKKAEES